MVDGDVMLNFPFLFCTQSESKEENEKQNTKHTFFFFLVREHLLGKLQRYKKEFLEERGLGNKLWRLRRGEAHGERERHGHVPQEGEHAGSPILRVLRAEI